MGVFVAGATGAVGRRLVPQLIAAGHEVTATTRTPGTVELVRSTGATPMVLDGLDHGHGAYNIVDDEPAPLAEWLPYFADVIGAKPPRHVPAWIARLAAGEVAESWRGSSNAKAKAELEWAPRGSSWRDGFSHGLTDMAGTEQV